MKKIITSPVLALAVLLGSIGLSTPAQAISGSSVHFIQVNDGIPLTIDLHNTSITGYQYLQEFATTRNNVARTCPKSTDYFLFYTNPNGGRGVLDPGVCLVPVYSGTYDVGIGRA